MEGKLNRFDALQLVLQFCSENGGVFTIGERICINQERAKLIAYEFPELIRECNFNHSEKLSAKIVFYLNLIQKKKWTPKPYDFF